jgi:hypothetical protein
MGFELSILHSSAWAPGLDAGQTKPLWAKEDLGIECSDEAPSLPFLPSLFKRRLGQLDRMVLHVGHAGLSGGAPARIVLATRRGEIGQQYRISASLAESGEVSPAAFSLSVFNAPASLLSIAEGNTGAVSAVHAGEHSLAAGLVCCIGMLAKDVSPVLLIVADEILPEAYAELEGNRGQPFALAMLLAPGRDGAESVIVDLSTGGAMAEPGLPEALVFLRWLAAGSGPLRLGGPGYFLALSHGRREASS